MKQPSRLTIVSIVVLLMPVAFVFGEAGDYTGHKVVRVEIKTQADLEFLQSISPDIWSDPVGIRPLVARIPPERMEELQNSGLSFEIGQENLQESIDAERKRLSQARSVDTRDPAWFTEYKTNDQINQFLDDLVVEYPNLISKYQIGTSFEGRPIYGLTITSPVGGPGKPALCFDTMQHSREWIGPMTVLYIVDRLLLEYDTEPDIQFLLDKLTFYVAPVINPDGYVYSWGNGHRLWRKTRRDNGDGTYGVDWNRNWETGWGGTGSSGDTSSDTYRGTAPFSEPETQVMRDYLLAHPEIRAHIDFHSYSQLVLRPYGYDYIDPPEPDLSLLSGLGQDMADAIFDTHGKTYTSQPASALYLAGGCCADWVYAEGEIYSWTFELRPHADEWWIGFQLPPNEIIPTGEENFEAVCVLAEYFAVALRFGFPDGLPSCIAAGEPTTIAVTISDAGEDYVPGSGMLHYRFNPAGSFVSVPLTSLGGEDFEAAIPAGPCNSTVEYYFNADGSGGGTATSPLAAPADIHTAAVTGIVVLFADNFETENYWAPENLGATSGQWERGVPVDDDNWEYDPASDSDGSSQCYLTQNTIGNSDVDDGAVQLTSPTLDMSHGNVLISYDYFLRLTNSDGDDRLLVEINNNGGVGTWTEIARHDSDGGLNWRHHEIDQSALDAAGVALTSTMKMRFTANDADSQSIVEAGLDAFLVIGIGCTVVPGDADGDGDVDLGDFALFPDCMAGPDVSVPASCLVPASVFDFDEDGDVDLQDFGGFQGAFMGCR
ncbi:MAG: hypothetical protein KAV82_09930 [Phycisphaerae bacterium]|nr:hypothetical protein [Phycisphaerae bacterium]